MKQMKCDEVKKRGSSSLVVVMSRHINKSKKTVLENSPLDVVRGFSCMGGRNEISCKIGSRYAVGYSLF